MVATSTAYAIKWLAVTHIGQISRLMESELYENGGSVRDIPYDEKLARLQSGRFFGAVQNSEVLGIASLAYHNSFPEVSSIVVLEKYRNNGIAHRLISTVEKEAVRRGEHEIYSVSTGENFLDYAHVADMLDRAPNGKRRHVFRKSLPEDI